MSDHQHAIQTLREYNLWRRADEDMDQPDPREIGQAIDAAIEAMEELNEWKTLTGWGGTPEIINDFIQGQQSRIYAAQEAEEQRDRMAEENKQLRAILPRVLDVLGNGSGCVSDCSLKFLQEIPQEVKLVINLIKRERDRMAEAAKAVVDRWETPFWKQVEHTGVYIAALRKAVEEVKGGQP